MTVMCFEPNSHTVLFWSQLQKGDGNGADLVGGLSTTMHTRFYEKEGSSEKKNLCCVGILTPAEGTLFLLN